jgi:hypothetical protein
MSQVHFSFHPIVVSPSCVRPVHNYNKTHICFSFESNNVDKSAYISCITSLFIMDRPCMDIAIAIHAYRPQDISCNAIKSNKTMVYTTVFVACFWTFSILVVWPCLEPPCVNRWNFVTLFDFSGSSFSSSAGLSSFFLFVALSSWLLPATIFYNIPSLFHILHRPLWLSSSSLIS